MKKIFILALFLSAATYAQDCKFAINKIDDFDKIKIVQTKEQPIATQMVTTFYVSLINDGSTGINLRVVTGGNVSAFITEVDTAQILLTNGEVVKLNPAKSANTIVNDLGNSILSVRYLVSESDLDLIQKTGIKKIRLNYSGGSSFDLSVKEKWMVKLKAEIQCFLSEIKK